MNLCILELPQLRGSTPATPLWGSGGKGEGKCGVRDHPQRRRPRPCHLSIHILSNYYLLLKRRTEYIGSSAVLSSPGHIQCACKVYLALLANQIPRRCAFSESSLSPASFAVSNHTHTSDDGYARKDSPHFSLQLPHSNDRQAICFWFRCPCLGSALFGSRTPGIIHHDRIFHWRCISGSVFGGSPYPCDIKD
jgi:hypothetical protein